ncbi:MAG: sugar ABC transporter permease [Treponema sp.]|nr:sugar ABC transporter permease [Treponema sp.]
MSEKLDIKKALKNNTMVFALIGVMVLFQILIVCTGHGSLFVPANITNLINQNAWVVILATGMLLCILTGGNVDLSVGSVLCFVGAVGGSLMVNQHWNVGLVILICIIVGTLIGAIHGVIIAYLHVPPFITTLAGMLMWRGLANVILQGMTISPMPNSFMKLFASYLFAPKEDSISIGTLVVAAVCVLAFIILSVISRGNRKRKGYDVPALSGFIAKLVILSAVIVVIAVFLSLDKGLPVVLILLAIIVGAYSYYTQNTVPGRYLYAIGGNAKAAKLSGVNTDNVMMFAYTNNGFIAAIAALVIMARFNSASPTVGNSYEMDAIASCFIGGASAYGGTGKVSGAVIGAVFMGVLNNGMSILGVDSNWQKAVKGIVLLLAVIFDVVSKKKKASK